MHRSQREMEVHDKNKDGLLSFAEYEPPSWTRNTDPTQEVRETCELALKRIDDTKNSSKDSGQSITEASPFLSVDPVAPSSCCSSVDELREVLLNEKISLYERYAALFSLGNNRTMVELKLPRLI